MSATGVRSITVKYSSTLYRYRYLNYASVLTRSQPTNLSSCIARLDTALQLRRALLPVLSNRFRFMTLAKLLPKSGTSNLGPETDAAVCNDRRWFQNNL